MVDNRQMHSPQEVLTAGIIEKPPWSDETVTFQGCFRLADGDNRTDGLYESE